jgi:hypothetical protein
VIVVERVFNNVAEPPVIAVTALAEMLAVQPVDSGISTVGGVR